MSSARHEAELSRSPKSRKSSMPPSWWIAVSPLGGADRPGLPTSPGDLETYCCDPSALAPDRVDGRQVNIEAHPRDVRQPGRAAQRAVGARIRTARTGKSSYHAESVRARDPRPPDIRSRPWSRVAVGMARRSPPAQGRARARRPGMAGSPRSRALRDASRSAPPRARRRDESAPATGDPQVLGLDAAREIVPPGQGRHPPTP